MLQRILELPEDVRRRYDVSSLRAVCSAGAPLSADLATAFMDEFGDVVFNLYGTTETGFAGLATPAGPARRARHRRPRAAGRDREDPRRRPPAGAGGNARARLRRQRDDCSRATPAGEARRSSTG